MGVKTRTILEGVVMPSPQRPKHVSASRSARAFRWETVCGPEGRPTLRRCMGSGRYSFEAHHAPVEDFPAQPSQREGLGRMCKTHWRQCPTDRRHRTVHPSWRMPGEGRT
jgi:hypothetical protein